MNEISDTLFQEMQSRPYPNCTLYLIWHYLKNGQVNDAECEFVRDSDKLGASKGVVQTAINRANRNRENKENREN